MPSDGATLTLPYPLDALLDGRCDVYKPVRPLTNGDPDETEWAPVHINWPFYWKRSRGLDQPEMAGRYDQDLVFTIEMLWMPVETDVDQDYWLKDRTTIPARGNSRNFGRFFKVRGNPSWFELPFDRESSYQVVTCSIEARVPRNVTAALVA